MAFEQNQAINRLIGSQPLAQSFDYLNPTSRAPKTTMQPLQQSPGFLGSLKNYLFGSPAQQFSYSPYTQNQLGALEGLLASGSYNMQNPYEGFDLLQQQIMDQYQRQIIPQLAEQFTSGTGGAASSPAFVQSLQGGAQDLASRLLAHKLNYGQQNRALGLQQLQSGLRPTYEMGYIPGQQGLVGSVAQRGIPALASLFGLSRFGGY